jgi:hypothetical protein
MVSALSVEEQRVASGNWSFRCETRDFEFLWPVEKMIAVPYAPNLKQLLRYRGSVAALIDAHDASLEHLRLTATATYDRLLRSEPFRKLASSATIAEDDRRYVAEYVVDGICDLLPHYSLHELWARQGSQFLALRTHPALARDFASLRDSGRDFATKVGALSTAIEGLQRELADAYKLPPVDPSDAVRV